MRCRSTIIPPPPSGVDYDTPATLRVPPVPHPANDLLADISDSITGEMAIDEDLVWDDSASDRTTLRREEVFRLAAPTWRSRVA